MNIEDELRGALDVAAPPPTTTLDVVLRRGRRRVFAQRAGAVFGVVAVVAGIGIGATTLNQAAPPSPAQPPDLPSTVVHEVAWPRVSAPPQTPSSTWTPPAGVPIPEIPQCELRQRTLPPVTWIGQMDVDGLTVGRYVDTLGRRLPGLKVTPVGNRAISNPWEYEVDLADEAGTGGIKLAAGHFTGPPKTVADDALWVSADCLPPRRTVLADGTILQLHSVRVTEPFQTLTQALYVYRPDGLQLLLELRNFGSKDTIPDPNQAGAWQRTGAGRPTLPLTEEQFATLGLAVAEGV